MSDDAIIKEIEALDAKRLQALLDGDVDTVAGLVAPSLRYTHSSAASDDHDAYLESLRGKYRYQAFKDLGRSFQVHGDTVLVCGDTRIDVHVNGTPKVVMSRYLAVWLRQNGQWKFAAWQSTPIPA
ncbi:MAG: nuclear transport factor 2 family protein [Quisquiliibacterium sp.]